MELPARKAILQDSIAVLFFFGKFRVSFSEIGEYNIGNLWRGAKGSISGYGEKAGQRRTGCSICVVLEK